jgi:DNA-binding CsgD family transcriptional regulator
LVLPRIEDEQPGGWLARRSSADGPPGGRQPSRREREILAHLARGSTDAQIAEVLELSPATVQTHVRNAKAKLGARTRAQAVALALVSGLIELD